MFLAKDLLSAKKAKNGQFENNINDGLIDLRNANIRKEFPENEIPNKIVGIVEKVFDFNQQQKGKRIKTLTPKQMLQRLPIALAHVKAGNTSGNLLNEIRNIIYSLCQEKEVTKNLYNNIINSIKL